MSRSAIGIVGASLAGVHAAGELRRGGYDGRIVVIGDEPHRPYDRPPLSKELLRGDRDATDIRLRSDDAADVEWRLGATATALDAASLTVTLDDGSAERFADGIVIATGARPRRPRAFTRPGVHVLRTLDDARSLAAELATPRDVLIVGAGFIGLEVAASARALGSRVTVVESLAAPLQRALGAEIGARVGALHVAEGVELRCDVSVDALGDGHAELGDGTRVAADVVVVGVGVDPCTDWLEGSGLRVDDGVLCDATCLAAPGIVAAGDVARWPSARRDELRRVEHWDNAMRQGIHAARRLLADAAPPVYDPLPWFWSDQYTHKLQLLGSAQDADEVVVIGDDGTAGRLIALYRRGDRAVAAFGIGRPKQMVACRRLLAGGPAPWDDAVATVREAVGP